MPTRTFTPEQIKEALDSGGEEALRRLISADPAEAAHAALRAGADSTAGLFRSAIVAAFAADIDGLLDTIQRVGAFGEASSPESRVGTLAAFLLGIADNGMVDDDIRAITRPDTSF